MIPTGRYRSESQRFSRPWWTEGFKTLLWVAVVTVLIWVYADMRFTDHRTLTGHAAADRPRRQPDGDDRPQ